MKTAVKRFFLFIIFVFVVITIIIVIDNSGSILASLTGTVLYTVQAYRNFPIDWVISALIGAGFMAIFDRVLYKLIPRKWQKKNKSSGPQ